VYAADYDSCMFKRRPWQEELEIIDRTMKTISSISDPEQLVNAYWEGIGDLLPPTEFVSLSRRYETAPFYRVTRSSRFTEDLNPWTQRDQLPLLQGGILSEIVYANKPIIIDDLPARLAKEDPGWFYLQGYQHLVALPNYDNGEGVNVSCLLFPPGLEPEHKMLPVLHWQGGLFGRGTQNLVLKNQLSGALEALNRELEAVGDIQHSLLPETLPSIPGFEIAADYQTSARAGGDYYDFFPLTDVNNGHGLFIADVSGHGTPAAVFMAITHSIAHARPGKHTPPGVLLGYVNDRLTRSYTRGGTFVTAFYAVLDPGKRTLTYARAGHNPPRLVRNGKVMALDQVGGLPLGILDDQPFDETTVQLQGGDLLLLYTDGITEAMAPKSSAASRDLFGTERLDPLLVSCDSASPADCIAKIRAELAAFTHDAPPNDDRTLIAIRCL